MKVIVMRLPYLLIFLFAVHAGTGLAQEKGTKSAELKTTKKSKADKSNGGGKNK